MESDDIEGGTHQAAAADEHEAMAAPAKPLSIPLEPSPPPLSLYSPVWPGSQQIPGPLISSHPLPTSDQRDQSEEVQVPYATSAQTSTSTITTIDQALSMDTSQLAKALGVKYDDGGKEIIYSHCQEHDTLSCSYNANKHSLHNRSRTVVIGGSAQEVCRDCAHFARTTKKLPSLDELREYRASKPASQALMQDP